MSGLQTTMALIGMVMVSSMVVSRALRRLVGTVFVVLGMALMLFALMASLAGDCRLNAGAAWPQLICGAAQ